MLENILINLMEGVMKHKRKWILVSLAAIAVCVVAALALRPLFAKQEQDEMMEEEDLLAYLAEQQEAVSDTYESEELGLDWTD